MGTTLTSTHPPIEVRIADGDRWQEALDRARTRALAIVPHRVTDRLPAGVTLAAWLVASASRDGHRHLVVVSRDEWSTQVRCGCTAGAFGLPCLHAALAIETSDAWPAGMPLRRALPEEPAPASQPEPELPVACPYCGSASGLHAAWRETTGAVWGHRWHLRCLDCRAHLGYCDALDHASLAALCATATGVSA